MSTVSDLESVLEQLRNIDMDDFQDLVNSETEEIHDVPRGSGIEEEESKIKQLLSQIAGEAETISYDATELERFLSTG